MTDREKLIELVEEGIRKSYSGCWDHDCKDTCQYRDGEHDCMAVAVAETLLAHGVIMLPCKIDTPIYVISGEKEPRKKMQYRVDKCNIDHFTIGGTLIPMITACSEDNEWYELIDGTMEGHEYWLSREEAEAALKEGE